MGIRVKRVSIVPDQTRDTLGHVHHSPDVNWETGGPRELERGLRELIVALAGGEAERLVKGRADHMGARGDYADAADYALSMCVGDEAEASALMKYAQLRTRRLVAWEG